MDADRASQGVARREGMKGKPGKRARTLLQLLLQLSDAHMKLFFIAAPQASGPDAQTAKCARIIVWPLDADADPI